MVNGQALGMIETLGLTALIAAADAAAKTADVRIYSYEKADAGIMTVYIYGDISSVQEAVRVGKETAKSMGKLLHYSVIPSPGFDFSQWIRRKKGLPVSKEEDRDEISLLQLSVTELRKRVRSLQNPRYSSTKISKADKGTLVAWLIGTSIQEE
ncbi:BMC domain-containing protein [Cohnella sp. WQ 127256]|uniref:BMC domain-containing protein n=1 Tax=Cohnella sp. WQ 127256 TaxID=2938790 RepID=UPI0021189991|nr:BMC domain-containing protein [Cohnella sp. WQ 127256]